MYPLTAGGWPLAGGGLAEDRELAERFALQEARIATDSAASPASPTTPRLAERVRRALGLGRTEPDCVACPA